MKRLIICFLALNLFWIIPVRAEIPLTTNTDGVVFFYMVDNFPEHTIMNLGESRSFSIRVARFQAQEGAVYTGRWFRNNIAIGEEFNINIPTLGSIDVHFNIINAAALHSGLYTLRVTTIFNNTITHIDTSRGMNIHILQLDTPPPDIPAITAPTPGVLPDSSVHVGSQWGAPISNMLSFPVTTIGIPNGFYRISLSGLPLDVTVSIHARIHNGLFNPQLQISNIWAATPGNYIITLTIYDAFDNTVAASSPFLLTIFDHGR